MINNTAISQDPRPCHTLLNSSQVNNKDQPESFEPFTLKLDPATKPMQIISNLHQMKECELDHEYISQHLEQLQMDPTLCLKCSSATKYFCSPEPVVQELYKKSCHWRKCPDTILSMDNSLLLPSTHRNNTSRKQAKRASSYQEGVPISTRQQRVHTYSKNELTISTKDTTR